MTGSLPSLFHGILSVRQPRSPARTVKPGMPRNLRASGRSFRFFSSIWPRKTETRSAFVLEPVHEVAEVLLQKRRELVLEHGARRPVLRLLPPALLPPTWMWKGDSRGNISRESRRMSAGSWRRRSRADEEKRSRRRTMSPCQSWVTRPPSRPAAALLHRLRPECQPEASAVLRARVPNAGRHAGRWRLLRSQKSRRSWGPRSAALPSRGWRALTNPRRPLRGGLWWPKNISKAYGEGETSFRRRVQGPRGARGEAQEDYGEDRAISEEEAAAGQRGPGGRRAV